MSKFLQEDCFLYTCLKGLQKYIVVSVALYTEDHGWCLAPDHK